MHTIQNNTCPPDFSRISTTARTSSAVGLVGIAEDFGCSQKEKKKKNFLEKGRG
jgi:hypothetical protein